MTKLEQILGPPLTRVVCRNHQAELPYRALFRGLDGNPTGPLTLSGPIGKMLDDSAHEMPIVKFEPAVSSTVIQLAPFYRSARALLSINIIIVVVVSLFKSFGSPQRLLLTCNATIIASFIVIGHGSTFGLPNVGHTVVMAHIMRKMSNYDVIHR